MPVWQQFVENNLDVGFLSIAVDAQGIDKVRVYHEKAKATFTTVVDQKNLLGQLYGFKAVPNGFLIDESGTVVYKKLGGFDIRRSETASVVENWVADNADSTDAAASDDSLGPEHSEAVKHFQDGWEMYHQGNRDGALAEWRKGVVLEPDNWIIRKQIWAAEHPDKFYDGPVDFDWQKEQISKGI